LKNIHRVKLYNGKTYKEVGEQFNKRIEHLREDKDECSKFLSTEHDAAKWKEFKPYFLEVAKRCPICECTSDNYDDIDHYRPKSIYWWLSYEYRNYVLLCEICNRSLKKKKFPLFGGINHTTFANRKKIGEERPLLFNPLNNNPLDFFEIEFSWSTKGEELIYIRPYSGLKNDSYEYKLAEETIDVYNLNATKMTSKQSRSNLMVVNSSSLYNLAISRHSYFKNPKESTKNRFVGEIKRSYINGGLGLGILVIKGRYKWFNHRESSNYDSNKQIG